MGNIRYCKKCKSKLKRNGKTVKKRQRWYCSHCKSSKLIRRPDLIDKRNRKLFHLWSVKSFTQSEYGFSRWTFLRRIKKFRFERTIIPSTGEVHNIMMVDGIRVGDLTILIALGDGYPIGSKVVSYETYENWKNFLSMFPEPKSIVCDGQNGLIKAINECYKHSLVQRCLVHVIRNIRGKLSNSPKTLEGIELLKISKKLTRLSSKEDCNNWVEKFNNWFLANENFIKTKSYSENTTNSKRKWWYTHKRVRSAYFQLKKLVDNQSLFSFLNSSDFVIPKTSNKIEGGINSPIRNLLIKHRGLKTIHQCLLVEKYLFTRTSFYNQIATFHAT